MKRTLICKIENELEKLAPADVESHVWWNRFMEMVKNTEANGEQTEIEIDIERFTENSDFYRFKKKNI